ncbi:TPA: ribulose-phosphate 3-epimerase [Candidatus Gastranaerophilales bacterium HUM_2]|nr:MAG TPA: ribulose-phosphate 3-epimerase [Candidatus Gastranaerophilales bacterium HUM_2]
MIYVSPSILSADFANLERDIKRIEDGGADWVHVDVMDGHFVPNITIGVPVVASIRKVTKLPLDVHLMIENPEKYVEPFVKAGADILTFHYECGTDIKKTIDLIKSFGIKVGLSIKPKTTPDVVFQYLKDLDLLLVMTVEPGFGGQKFMQDCADKIPVIKEKAPENLIIQVDGGINAETARICTFYGANSLVAGNYIYKSADIKSAIKSLR